MVGDPVLDLYLYGTTRRISREAPVLIVREDRVERRLGGAANAAANLAALGGRVDLVGRVGDDPDGEALIETARAQAIGIEGVVRVPSLRTVTKTRVLAGGLHTTKQQMLRIDREYPAPEAPSGAALVDAAKARMEGADAVVISDYGPGLSAYVEIAAEARKAGLPVVVDSRRSILQFSSVTVVTPNEPEIEAALHTTLRSLEDAARAAERVLAELDLEHVLLTRGNEGMIVASRGRASIAIQAHGPADAVDVTGAGDTVTATFALALASGASVLDGAVLANCAASVVVQLIGTACCDRDALAASIDRFDPSSVGEVE